MPQTIKMLAAVLCAASVLQIALLLVPVQSGSRYEFSSPPRHLPQIILPGGLLGALCLAVDALIRQYDSAKAWPIVLGVMGLCSFGLTSLLYYAGWGWLPARRARPPAEQFCSRCMTDSGERTCKGLGTRNGMGFGFFGGSDFCDQCGSTIKTVWFLFIIPVIPIASYRVLPVGRVGVARSGFISRKTRFTWKHVLPFYLGAAILIGVPILYAYI